MLLLLNKVEGYTGPSWRQVTYLCKSFGVTADAKQGGMRTTGLQADNHDLTAASSVLVLFVVP